MTDDDLAALHNRLRQNQAYNDHIVTQQNLIVKQFDKIGSLEKTVSFLEDELRSLRNSHDQLYDEHDHLKDSHETETAGLKDDTLHLGDFFSDLTRFVEDLKATYEKTTRENTSNLQLLKADLESFKKQIFTDWNIFVANTQNIHQQNKRDLSDHFEEVKKLVPETPPYIQDLKDKIDHNLRIFSLKVDQALDKATHIEMLYAALQKRTRIE